MKTPRTIGLAVLLAVLPASAQLIFTSLGKQTIDFDSNLSGVANGPYTGLGFQSSPAAGELDSDAWAVTGFSDGSLAFGGTQIRNPLANDFSRGFTAGAVTTGGIYSFDLDTSAGVNRAFGIQPGADDFTTGTLTLRLQNQTGAPINILTVSYSAYYRNDVNRSSSFNFSHSSDDISYTSVSGLNLSSPDTQDALGWVENERSTTITGLNIANNGFFYLRWTGDDIGGSGSRDEFALDDIMITAAVPEPATFVAFSAAGLVLFGCWRRIRR